LKDIHISIFSVYEKMLAILEDLLGVYKNEHEAFIPVPESLTIEYEYILALFRLLYA